MGRRLRTARERCGITTSQVAAALRCHRTNVAHIEAGRQRASVEQLRAMAELFGCSMDDLAGLRQGQAS